MKLVIVAIPHAMTWFYTQTCVECLRRYPPVADGCECYIVVVDNSWDFSPSYRGITETDLSYFVKVVQNPKPNKFHASALDHVVETYDFDYLMTLENDVCVLRPDWLQWFMNNLETDPKWYAVGHWHHEGFINPSCTLYRGPVLRDMLAWCKTNASLKLRWGDNFEKTEDLIYRLPHESEATKRRALEWISGPFAERRGWPEGTILRERPTGQSKGPGHYEPGQLLYHWARENGDLGYLAMNTFTFEHHPGFPLQTLYGHGKNDREYQLDELLGGPSYASHFWCGTRGLNILKHDYDDSFEEAFASFMLQREARFWRQVVPDDIQRQTLALVQSHGFMTASKRQAKITAEDRNAEAYVVECYRKGGLDI
jgi:hypothetical protein